MADKADKADNKAEKKAEPAPAPKHEMHGFWQSGIGKIVALLALWFFLPTDEILEKGVKPALAAGHRALRKGWAEAVSAKDWLSHKASRIIWATVIAAFMTLGAVFLGIHLHNRVIVAIGGGAFSLYLLCAWFVARLYAGILAKLVEKGSDLSGTILGGVLAKVGIAEDGLGDTLKIDLEGVRTFLKNAFVIVIVALGATGFLVLVPTWRGLGLGIITSIFIGLGIAVAVHKNLPTEDGWKMVYKWSKHLAIYTILMAVLAAPLAVLLDAIKGSGFTVRSLANPLFILLLCAVIPVVFLVLSALQKDDKRKDALKILAKVSAGIIPLALLLMCLNGTISWPGIKGSFYRFRYGTRADVVRNDAPSQPSAPGPISGQTGDLVPPPIPTGAATTAKKPSAGPLPDVQVDPSEAEKGSMSLLGQGW